MVGVLDSLSGEDSTEQSIIAAERDASSDKGSAVGRSTANLPLGQIKTRWVCSNIQGHSSGEKIVIEAVMLDGRKAVCPECGHPLVRMKSVVS